MSGRRAERLAWLILVLVAAANLLYLARAPFDLFCDEAYYWDWSRHPAAGYVSKGPVVAWCIRLGTALAGPTELGVRWPALALAALTGAVLLRLAKRLGGPRAMLFTALSLALAPLFGAGQWAMTTDPPLALLWALTLAAWTLAAERLERGRPPGGAAGWGYVALALAWLAKPSALLLVPTLGLWLARRRWLGAWSRAGAGWVGLLGAAALVAPTLAWNAARGWPLVDHVGRQLGVGAGWSCGLPEFLVTQLAVLSPWLWIFLLLTNWTALRQPRSAAEELLALGCLLTLSVCAGQSLVGKVEANWALPAYLSGLPVAAGRWTGGEAWRDRWRRWQPHAVRWGLVAGLWLRLAPVAAQATGSPLLLAADPTRRAQGLAQLGQILGRERAALAAAAGVAPALVALRYQAAAAAAFYTPGQPETTVLDYDRPAVAYDFWPAPELTGRPLLLVVRRGDDRLPAWLTARVESWRHRRVVLLREGRAVVDEYHLFELHGYRGPEGERW